MDYVEMHGPLWAWSCFPFEDMNGAHLMDYVEMHGRTKLVVILLLCMTELVESVIKESEVY